MIKIYQMDVMEALKQMPDESVDMQITSPPYWGLRDYGEGTESIWDGKKRCEHEFDVKKRKLHSGTTKEEWVGDMSRGIRDTAGEWETKDGFCSKCGAWKGQLGLEPDFNLYIKHLCDIFDEVKRILKKDGTCWVNLGDTYHGGNLGVGQPEDWKSILTDNKGAGFDKEIMKDFVKQRKQMKYTAKCLCAIPERFMIEMINRGWILRNKIIWHKPNHMPTSVKDRFANSWEYLFMFSKNKKYYFDLDAVRESHKHGVGAKFLRVRDVKRGYAEKSGQYKASDKEVEQYHGQSVINNPKGKNPDDILEIPYHPKGDENKGMRLPPQANQPNAFHKLGKNPSDFWDITTKGYKEAHFAVFPEKLVERPIKTTPIWICKKCGKARERITKSETERITAIDGLGSGQQSKSKTFGYSKHFDIGWTDCGCNAGWKPAVIMDIFAGSGTTLKVARELYRDSIGIEIKPEYVELIKKRLSNGNQTLFPQEFEVIT